MQKTTNSRSGLFIVRAAVACALFCFAILLGVFSLVSFATPNPPSGTLTAANGTQNPLTFTDTSPLVPNPTGEGVGFSQPTCTVPNTCSTYTLNLDPTLFVSNGSYVPAQNNIIIQISWPTSQVQYGSFVVQNGAVIASNTAGIDPETITVPVSLAGLSTNGPLKIITTAEIGTGTSLTGTISVVPISGGGQACSACIPPRYQMYEAPSGVATQSGEPSIGVDWNPNVQSFKNGPNPPIAGTPRQAQINLNTGGLTIFTATFDQYQVGFDDCSSPAVTSWTDIAFPTQQITTLDAIGFTDHFTRAELGTGPYSPGAGPAPNGFTTPGRTFHGQLTAGDSNTSYTDDDGANHTQSQGGGVPQGPDHETFGAGPYAPTNTNASPPVVEPPHPTYPNAVYYCTQNIAPEAECSRSDDGGLTFGPGVPIYTPTQCTGSIHGHVKVARDGTVYVPNYSCTLASGNQGVAVSTDNGITWTENNVPGSGSPKPGLVDPSVAVALNDIGKPAGQTTNTIYFGYIDIDGTPKVTASGDRGAHWLPPQNVGAAFNIVNSTFPVVVAGDDNRAAFGFLGTTTSGDSSLNANFPGVWHLYIAQTIDGGNHWVTIDATPNDPVQVGPVCNGGTTCPTKRNLLDFNGFDVDSEGRGLLGLSDGCVNCVNTSGSGDSNAAQGLIARQSGGPRLFMAFDPPAQAPPASPQVVSATRDSTGVLVSWLEPDNGGAPITAYNVYRGTTSGGEGSIPIATVAIDPLHNQTKYLDTTAIGNSSYFYRVTAVNSQGESPFCNELSVVAAIVQGNACTFPYLTMNGAGSVSALATFPTEQQIQYVNIGEPFTTCTDNSVTFVMKVPTLDPTGTGQAVPPPNTEYQILFNVTDTNGNPKTIYVEMDTNCPIGNSKIPEFTYGRRDPGTTGTFDQGECTSQQGVQTCAAISGSYSPDGTIVIKLDVSQPLTFSANTGAADATEGAAFTWDGHATGTHLQSVSSDITLFAGCGAGFLETLSSSSGGAYTRVGNQSCSPFIPIAQLSASPLTGNAPLVVTFDASSSHEPAGACGTISSYTLNFGDGSTAVTQSSPSFSHTYRSPGDYAATLTVTDSSGKTSTNPAEQVITVNDNPPTAALSASSTSGKAPLTVAFDASRSSDPDPGDSISSYTFTFGDGSAAVTQNTAKINHTYSNKGTYNARVTVKDSAGIGSTNMAQQTISVSAGPRATPTPTPSATPTPTPKKKPH
jgi:PKD repeat protein